MTFTSLLKKTFSLGLQTGRTHTINPSTYDFSFTQDLQPQPSSDWDLEEFRVSSYIQYTISIIQYSCIQYEIGT